MFHNIWILALSLLLIPQESAAHGVEGEIKYLRGLVVVTAWYDNGEPMSYAKVEIYAPNSTIKFQSGRTDRNGRMAFVPDISGKWRVVISDKLGHRLDLSINITNVLHKEMDENSQATNSSQNLSLSRSKAIVIGVLLIFGLFGWIKEIKRIKCFRINAKLRLITF